jgi:hypothetical protein
MMSKKLFQRLAASVLIAGTTPAFAQEAPGGQKIAVTTYHYDNLRTGWNAHEQILNSSLCLRTRVGCSLLEKFGLIAEVALDDTVYAQPLVVPDVSLNVNGRTELRDVVYVVTENNTVYAIDAGSGEILVKRNLDAAVPRPYSCANNGPVVGIESTPVIDLARHAMYLMSYKSANGVAYELHAIDLSTLADKSAPAVVSATHTLADGSTFAFNAADQRQRAALLLEDGNVYAAFASWCDASPARGWLLGWRARDLQPLASNVLTDKRPATNANKLSSIWMSGYGPSAIAGHIYFATGNSLKRTYNFPENLSESVVKVSADLSQLLDFFTPSNVNALDSVDEDLGSGGVMILPDQPGNVRQMAVVAGKEGQMYLLNRNNLGGVSKVANNILGQFPIGACWCGESYYANNVVSSGGAQIGVWRIDTSPTPRLTRVQSATIDTLGNGFFTAVSSNGDKDMIIWAVSQRHSRDGGPEPTLYAFTPISGDATLSQIFKNPAGNWDVPHPQGDGANSNIVPVVANGRVYVASYKRLDIFGFGRPVVTQGVVAEAQPPAPGPNEFAPRAGVVSSIEGSRFTMRTDENQELKVNAEEALEKGLSPKLSVGEAVSVYGVIDQQGILHAEVIRPAHQ